MKKKQKQKQKQKKKKKKMMMMMMMKEEEDRQVFTGFEYVSVCRSCPLPVGHCRIDITRIIGEVRIQSRHPEVDDSDILNIS
jgi:ferredoxin